MFKNIYFYMLPVALFATMFLSSFGFEDSDTGFILSFGWRMLNGDLPYVDFSYVRPFMSLLHSYWLMLITPESYQVLIFRITSTLLLFTSTALAVQALDNEYDLKNAKYPIALCSFLLAQYSLSTMMMWHTIDGIFYSSLGIYFISKFNNKENGLYLFFATTVFCLAFLAKQNYLAVLVAFLILSLFKYKNKFHIILFAVAITFYLIDQTLHHFGIAAEYYDSIVGKTELIDIVKTGLIPYASWVIDKELLSLLTVTLLIYYFVRKRFTSIWLYSTPIISVFVGAFILTLFFNFGKLDPIRIFRLDHFFSFLVGLHLLSKFVQSPNKIAFIKRHIVLLLSLTIAWATSVSWGLSTPLLFILPIVAYISIMFEKHQYSKHAYKTLTILSILYISNIYIPYRSPEISLLTYDMGNISVKSKGIRADEEIYKKYQALKELDSTYNLDVTTVLPSMPLAHYMLGKNNPYFIDWAMDVESNRSRAESITTLNDCCDYVFIEKKRIGQTIDKPGKRFYSSISDHVLQKWTLVEKQEYFSVYANPKLNLSVK